MSQEKIARVESFPLRYAEPNNNGKTRHIALVRLETASGAVGWGEAITGTDDASYQDRVGL
jgi:L-alanine-DL-glutamate epimerase-like enolase superfamily enzyme